MGPIESACVDRARAARAALYCTGYEPPEPEPKQKPEFEFQPCDPNAMWVQAMRVDDSTKVWMDRVFISDVQREVCAFFELTKKDLLSHRRNKSIVRPRQVGMYLAKILTSRSLPEIGRRFGNRDHTTVLHAIRKVEELMASNLKFSCEVQELKRRLTNG